MGLTYWCIFLSSITWLNSSARILGSIMVHLHKGVVQKGAPLFHGRPWSVTKWIRTSRPNIPFFNARKFCMFKLACFAEATSTWLRYRVLINYIWQMQNLELKSEKCFERHQMPLMTFRRRLSQLYIVWSVVSQNSSAWSESTWLPSKTNIISQKKIANDGKWIGWHPLWLQIFIIVIHEDARKLVSEGSGHTQLEVKLKLSKFGGCPLYLT